MHPPGTGTSRAGTSGMRRLGPSDASRVELEVSASAAAAGLTKAQMPPADARGG